MLQHHVFFEDNMESLKELYRIGLGPSSSHTMGPTFASENFLEKYPNAARFQVTLYESLAATGKGHLTDRAILDVLSEEKTEILWQAEVSMKEHPNAMLFEAFDSKANKLGEQLYFSVGGGAIRTRETLKEPDKFVYPRTTLSDIMQECHEEGIAFFEYTLQYEGVEILDYLHLVWQSMKQTIKRGLATHGVLPGSIKLHRKAWNYYQRSKTASTKLKHTGSLIAYALATSEENAGGGQVVTAPTCGASGVMPSILYYMQEAYELSDTDIVKALVTAGIFGNIIKHNASISGAEVGCQGEVGSACAMAAAAASQLLGGTLRQVEYAAEMGLEHHLGLTCDPVDGLVQIPCIERNAAAAMKALSFAEMSILSDGSHNITFDEVVAVMKQTGFDLPSPYRETSTGGLAKVVANRKK